VEPTERVIDGWRHASATGRYRSTVRVMFDGFRSPTSLHRTYIEPVAGKEGSSSPDRC
jgi:hypothetical protein